MFAGVTELSAMESMMIALSGLVIVFLVLGCLAILIQINAKVITTLEANKKPAPVAEVKTAPAASNPQEDEELVAVLVAAIAAEMEANPEDFTITSIEEKR
ncbi:MAG: OadG family protein [Eubacteriales bacterium]